MFWRSLCGIRIADDDEYSVNKSKKSTIRVGNAFQASVPDAPCTPNDDIKLGEDKLLWNPSMLSEDLVKHYLATIGCPDGSDQEATIGCQDGSDQEATIGCRDGWDQERALWLLHRCNYKVDEAIVRHRCTIPSIHQLDTWTAYEKDCYSKGMHKYGKNFNAIQKVIRSKSVEEIIDYYYAAKKHNKPEKKKTKNRAALCHKS